MLNRVKKMLQQFINGLAILVLFALSVVYLWVNGVIMTAVLNELRLDTYMGMETGFGIVLLVFFLVWVPAYFLVRYHRR